MDPTPRPHLRFEEIPRRTTEVTVPTRHGDVVCTIYRPAGPGVDRPAVYVNAHGGGYIVARPEQDDPWCRFLAHRAAVVVVNVDYSVAPQARFPVPVEQVHDVLEWAAAPERDWDGTRLCVGGQSAGGAIAAGAARMALEAGRPALRLQVLNYPPLDLVTPAKEKRAGARRTVIQPWMAKVFDPAYVPDAAQRRHRLVSPAWGSNGEGIEGITPAVVVTPGLDRLHDEGAAYARALAAAGALVEHLDLPGADHAYNLMGDSPGTAERVYGRLAEHVLRATAPSA
ncbi:alpha/beta hydrolase fold domain-containing protein [Kocuria rosea]|uniref:Alpha/beta hydrolase n=1 Tax=Kocuria rosea TaxID=1275 RepID=A0A4R5YMA5_KOCRO|nr:alpha/beta hydrolase fold domain-containing protein [Kocuria rosea]TDL44567.1 alpha/beta hydrolase [Kocuria rosea]